MGTPYLRHGEWEGEWSGYRVKLRKERACRSCPTKEQLSQAVRYRFVVDSAAMSVVVGFAGLAGMMARRMRR